MKARRAPGPEPRAPLSRERVLRTAVALADEDGLESLTMRELGLRLGVEAMSLYNHVAGKDDLLDGMVDLVVGEIDLPSDAVGWKEAMRRRAISAQAVFSRHPWASALIDSRESSGLERLRYFEWVIGTLRRAGFSIELAARAFSVLDSYIYGFGRQRLNMSAGGGGEPEEMAEAFCQRSPPTSTRTSGSSSSSTRWTPATTKAPISSSASTSSSTGSRGFWIEPRSEGEEARRSLLRRASSPLVRPAASDCRAGGLHHDYDLRYMRL